MEAILTLKVELDELNTLRRALVSYREEQRRIIEYEGKDVADEAREELSKATSLLMALRTPGFPRG